MSKIGVGVGMWVTSRCNCLRSVLAIVSTVWYKVYTTPSCRCQGSTSHWQCTISMYTNGVAKRELIGRKWNINLYKLFTPVIRR